MYFGNHPYVRREAARRARSETPDQRRRRWQREQREFESRQLEAERERFEQQERAQHAEEARLAARTPEEVAADTARDEAQWQRYLKDSAEREERDRRRRAERADPYSTFGT